MDEFTRAAHQAFSDIDKAVFKSVAPRMLEVPQDAQSERWRVLRTDPQRRASFIQRMGVRVGARTPEQLQQLENDYMSDMTRRFGDG